MRVKREKNGIYYENEEQEKRRWRIHKGKGDTIRLNSQSDQESRALIPSSNVRYSHTFDIPEGSYVYVLFNSFLPASYYHSGHVLVSANLVHS